MWSNLFIDIGATVVIIAGIWMIYDRIKMGPKMDKVSPYYKGQLSVSIPLGIVLVIAGVLILFRIVSR